MSMSGEALAEDSVARFVGHVRQQLAKIVIGQGEMVEQCMVALLVGGHVLLEGVPGLAKTLAVKTIARLLALDFTRVQCTSDLMPADILGTNILQQSSATFQLHRGPVFADLVLVDEINRMPPRTQAALLEAMEERQVTIDGKRYELHPHFTVFATQNPVEFEGTYPLPEAQLDRFLLNCAVSYPDFDDEVKILAWHQESQDATAGDREIAPVPSAMLEDARQYVRRVKVAETIQQYVVRIARATRDSGQVALGASPRAAVVLLLVSKAMAAIDGRDYVIPDDVKRAAYPVLRHRLILKPEAQLEGISSDQALSEIIKNVELPK